MKQISLFIGLGVLLTCTAAPSYAGIAGFINDTFTFREDQKDLVRPNYQLPPKHVLVPHYDAPAAAKWSAYYTRDDLVAEDYMDSSSKVMRPRVNGDNTLSYHSHPTRRPIDGRFNGAADRLGSAAPFGFEAIERRHHLNQTQGKGNVYIGAAGTTPFTVQTTGSNLGKKTAIGAPKARWDEMADGRYANARPGDFDYNRQRYDDPSAGMPSPERLTRAGGYGSAPERMLSDGGVEVQLDQSQLDQSRLDQSGLPTQYMVEPHDTLSGISGQEQIYGDWKLWPIIYNANTNQIDDPDLIHPGQNLGIPRDYTQEQEYGARQRAQAKQRSGNYSFFDGQ